MLTKNLSQSKIIRFYYLLLLLPILWVSAVQAQDFTIDNFHSEIVVNEDATIDVTETIKVEFDREKHGIYREIPYRYEDELGRTKTMPISVISVLDNSGNLWEYRVDNIGSVVNIRIGSADRYVDGFQTYIINYKVENALLFFDDHDELYWNVTGDMWRAQIMKATARVTIKTDKSVSKTDAACYTGYRGSKKSDCDFKISGKQVTFEANDILDYNEGFTIAFGWDKGIITPPSEWQQFLWGANLAENWVFGLPILTFLVMFFLWFTRGRDPRVREAVTVMYEPPEFEGKPLTAAQVGTLVDEKLDRRDLTASIVGLASKGYLEIHEPVSNDPEASKGSPVYKMIKLRKDEEDLTLFEKSLMHSLFPGEQDSTTTKKLSKRFYEIVPVLHTLIYDDLIKKKYFNISPPKVKGFYNIIGFAVMIFSFVISIFGEFWITSEAPWKGITMAILSGIIIIIFGNIMPAKTKAGALAKVHIFGFREFMNRADRDKIERMGQDVFYKYLPYAIALDVTDHWVEAFSGLLTEPPKWLVGPHLTASTFSASRFSQSLSSATSTIGSSVFSAPRGSGLSSSGSSFHSSSGGSSGGGGGGGGGGSW